jgi:hypothetical protein
VHIAVLAARPLGFAVVTGSSGICRPAPARSDPTRDCHDRVSSASSNQSAVHFSGDLEFLLVATHEVAEAPGLNAAAVDARREPPVRQAGTAEWRSVGYLLARALRD